MAENGSTDQSDEILATSSPFVPTALNVSSGSEPEHGVDWQTAIKRAVRDSARLRALLGLPTTHDKSKLQHKSHTQGTTENGLGSHVAAEAQFPTFVPLEYLRRIKPGDPNDPLLLQVLPTHHEDHSHVGETSDPVGDLDAMAVPGIIHKYHGRALMVVTGACGVHCRYCFRREFPYQEDSGTADRWEQAIAYLASHTEIEEVLLSGGDPLTRTDAALAQLIDQIEGIGHIRRLRIHSRMPVVIPQRITKSLVERLASSRLTVWFVIHANHPRELDHDVLASLGRLIDRGIPVLNQAVLLRGVNDDAATLIQLCRQLVDHRVQPYYLHQLDRVHGTGHYEVSVQRGQELMAELQAALPGYAVPKYVVEEAGRASKTRI